MLVPISWLKDYVDINVSIPTLAKKLVGIGFEVEDIIYQEFKASVFKIRADIDITCPKSNGIEIIKKSLDKGIEFDKNIEICLLNTPTFSISKTCNNKEIGFQCINNVLTIIKNEIENSGGEFHLMVAPKIYGEKNKHNMLQYKMDNSENDPNTESSSD